MSKPNYVYNINYGIAPYFKKISFKDIQLYQFHFVVFDKLLNRMLQEEQTDIKIRY